MSSETIIKSILGPQKHVLDLVWTQNTVLDIEDSLKFRIFAHFFGIFPKLPHTHQHMPHLHFIYMQDLTLHDRPSNSSMCSPPVVNLCMLGDADKKHFPLTHRSSSSENWAGF